MTYAIISVGGKQYRVREGQQVLVDRIALDDGETFTPPVLLVGGDGDTAIAPEGLTVTARVVGQERGPKIRIGKYRKRTGYRRHTGFRAALTKVEIESIGTGAAAKRTRAAKAEPKTDAAPAAAGSVPEGYESMTIAQIKDAVAGWEPAALRAALEYEQEHGKRKGALTVLESAIAGQEGG